MNEADTRYHLIDPVLRDKGYVIKERITLETILTPAPVEPSGAKGRRSKGPGRTDYLLCVKVGDMPKALPVAVLEAKKESEDPLKGMQQAKGYTDCERFDVKYVFTPMATAMASLTAPPVCKAVRFRLLTFHLTQI